MLLFPAFFYVSKMASRSSGALRAPGDVFPSPAGRCPRRRGRSPRPRRGRNRGRKRCRRHRAPRKARRRRGSKNFNSGSGCGLCRRGVGAGNAGGRNSRPAQRAQSPARRIPGAWRWTMPRLAPRARRARPALFRRRGKCASTRRGRRFSALPGAQRRAPASRLRNAQRGEYLPAPACPKVANSASSGSSRPSSRRSATCNPAASAGAESSSVPSMSKAMQAVLHACAPAIRRLTASQMSLWPSGVGWMPVQAQKALEIPRHQKGVAQVENGAVQFCCRFPPPPARSAPASGRCAARRPDT